MKKLSICFLILSVYQIIAQSPFGLSHKWYFSRNAGLQFVGAGNGTYLAGGQVNGLAQEGSSTMTDTLGNVLFYSNSRVLFNGTHGIVNNTLRGGTSCTQGNIIIPRPGTNDEFFLIVGAVDNSGGGDKGLDSELGIYWYRIRVLAGVVTIQAGPTLLLAHTNSTEQITATPHGNGRDYWVIAYNKGTASYHAWPFTNAGAGTAVITAANPQNWSANWQGSIKVNRCMTRLGAVSWDGKVNVFEWNPNTGVVGTNLRALTGYGNLYGAEFSPDGNMFYFSQLTLTSRLYQLNIGSGAVTELASNASIEYGTMQLGMDGRIYVARATDNVTPAYVAAITSPNTAGSGANFSNTTITVSTSASSLPNVYRGMANQSFIQPFHWIDNVIGTSPNCKDVNFRYNLRNYNNQAVGVTASSIEWDLGTGTFQSGLGANPNRTYATDGDYTIRMRVNDNTCNRTWTTQKTITINCPMPVVWKYFTIKEQQNRVLVEWGTAKELNNQAFEVQTSTDGVFFNSLARYEAKGNTTSGSDYQSVFETLGLSGKYVRIKQIDFDGHEEFSQVLKFESMSETAYQIVQKDNKHLLNMKNAKNSTVRLHDMNGRIVFEKEIETNEETVLSLPSEQLEGLHILSIINDNYSKMEKIVF